MADPPRKRYKWYLSQKSPLKSVPRSSRHALQSRMMKNDTRRNILNISATAIDNSTASDTSDDEQDQNFFFEDAEDDELKVAGTENDKITEANAPDIEKENFTDEDESEFESLADENWQEDIEDEVVEEALVAASSTSDEGRPSYEDQSTANQREDQVVEDQPLYEGAPITMGTSILLLMTFAINHSLSGAALSDLLELIAVHCKKPNLCTKSVYKFKSLFRELRTPLHCHYYCTFCNGLLEGSNVNICPYCKKAVTNDKIFKKSHFIEVPIELQLQDFFLRKGFYDDLGYRFTRKKKNVDNIEDVQDGSEYQRHFGPGGLLQQQSNVALQFNTDGVAIFKSSAFKIWPVYIEILDLPPNKRTLEENLVFAGLWFGSKSPVMNTFLKPYMKSHLHLERKGIPVSLPDRRQMTCKAILLNGTFDLPARCMVCNMMQYNGLCGCGICEEPGETLKVGKGHSHVYPMSHEMAKNPNGHAVLRTKESTKINAQEALNSGSLVTGVKGPSMLSFLPNFDIIKGVPLDYMHGVLLGVTKNLLNYWFNPKYNQEDWYCGNKLSDVDKMLASITPPNEITRLPRSIEHHKKYWKASELRSWLFHYSVPIMSTVLKAPYLHHFMLLAKGVYSLCKDSISQEDLEESSVLLKTFVYYMDKLYGKQASTANVHNLLHLVRCVIWNGPLWAFSCFSYEDANGKLRKLFHGTQHIQLQIVAAVSLKIKMPALVQNIPVESEALAFYEKLAMNSSALSIWSKGDQLLVNITHQITAGGRVTVTPSLVDRKTWEFVSTGCYMIGVPKSKKLADTVALALREVLGIPISIGHFYQRAMISSKVFHSKRYTRAQKRNSFTVMFKKDDEIEYGHIESFVKVRNNSCQCNEPTKCLCKSWMYFALINKIILPDYHRFEETDGVLAVKIDHVIKAHHAVDGNLVAVQIHQILEKVVCMDMPGHEFLYLSRFPNLFEKD